MTITIPLLRKVVEHIEAEPEHFYMSDYAWSLGDAETAAMFSRHLDRPMSCGTIGCIAGITVLLVDGEVNQNAFNIVHRARELLGLSPSAADDLFHPGRAVCKRLDRHPETVRAHVEDTLGVRL